MHFIQNPKFRGKKESPCKKRLWGWTGEMPSGPVSYFQCFKGERATVPSHIDSENFEASDAPCKNKDKKTGHLFAYK